MTMQRRHFEVIAKTINSLRGPLVGMTERDADRVAVHFANQLATLNPQFDRERFLKACGRL